MEGFVLGRVFGISKIECGVIGKVLRLDLKMKDLLLCLVVIFCGFDLSFWGK